MKSDMETLGSGELLVFSTESASPQEVALREHLKITLRRNGFEIDDIDERRCVLTPSRELIEYEATHAGLQKMLTPAAQQEQGMHTDDFDYATRAAFSGVDDPYFFTPAEICMLSHRVLYSVKVCVAHLHVTKQSSGSSARHSLIFRGHALWYTG